MRMDPPVSVPSATKAHARREGGSGAAARAAGRSGRVERIRTGPKADSSLVVPNANSCRLVLPMMMAPAAFQPHDDRRVRDGSDGRQGGARRRLDAGDVDQVLHRDWYAVQGPAIAPGANLLSRSFGVRQRAVVEPRDVGIDLWPARRSRQAGLNEVDGRECSGSDQGCDLDNRSRSAVMTRQSWGWRCRRVPAAGARSLASSLRIGVAQRGARLGHRLEERFQFAESPAFGVGACGRQPGLEAEIMLGPAIRSSPLRAC